MKNIHHLLIAACLTLVFACEKTDNQAPRVVATFPTNHSKNVDPEITEISVTFNKQMTDQSWSWAYQDKSKFPIITGQAYYTDDQLKNILPVKLEPNKTYEIWINSNQHQNFKDQNGNPAVPFMFTFETR